MRKGNCVIGALGVLCLAGFGFISRLVENHGIDGFDRAVAGWVQSFSDDRLVQFANILAAVGAPKLEMRLTIALVVLGVVALLWRRPPQFKALLGRVILFGLVNGVVFYANFWLKHLFHRPRPLAHIMSYSYPSSHAMMALAFYASVVYLLWPKLTSRAARVVVATVGGLMPLVIGISRVYLNWHYPSDILGAYLAGGGIILLSVLVFRNWPGLWQQERPNSLRSGA